MRESWLGRSTSVPVPPKPMVVGGRVFGEERWEPTLCRMTLLLAVTEMEMLFFPGLEDEVGSAVKAAGIGKIFFDDQPPLLQETFDLCWQEEMSQGDKIPV